MSSLFTYLKDVSHLVYPINCYGCNTALDNGEELVCKECLDDFPLTWHWQLKDNIIERLFWGKINLEGAAAFLYFSKGGIVQELLHQLKYKGRTQVGEFLGKRFGEAILETDFATCDLIVPVPLHADKKKKRGYNQCDHIGTGLSEVLQKPMLPHALERQEANKSQTKKGRYERWQNVKDLFVASNPEELEGKSVLLIDDVTTTGSTLEASAEGLLAIPGVTVFAVAIACPSPV